MRWAHHQLVTLNAVVAEYLYMQPYRTRVEDQPEAQAYKIVAHLEHAPPVALGLLVGDLLSNAVGVLDFLAGQLVMREGGEIGPGTYFPIRDSLKGDGSDPSVDIPGLDGKSAVNDPEVVAALREVQPYHEIPHAAEHPLAVLKRLNNSAKHRRITVVAHSLAMGTVLRRASTLYGAELPEEMLIVGGASDVQDGAELEWVPYVDSPEGPPPHEYDFTTKVSIEEAGLGAPLSDQMLRLLAYVDDEVLVRFARFFPQPAGI